MKQNKAGGYTFTLDVWKRLQRFLILGADKGTYYADKNTHALDNLSVVEKAVKTNGIQAVDMAVEVSRAGRAPNNDPALLVLAVASVSDDESVRQYAYSQLSAVARTGTHLFHFANFRQALGGWGKGLRKAISRWYQSDLDKTALQVIKYRQRDGWTHADLLRLAHPVPETEEAQALFAWITQDTVSDGLPSIVEGFLEVQKAQDVRTVIKLIEKYGLPREALPTQFLNEKAVWNALLQAGEYGMPMTALVRNLGKMSAVGLLTTGSNATKYVIEKLQNAEAIKYSRIHPMQLLYARATYDLGHGIKGTLRWAKAAGIGPALEKAFYTSFGNVEPTGKRTLLALDVSASMEGGWGWKAASILTPAQIAAAMTMVTLRSENLGDAFVRGFSDTFKDLGIDADDTLPQVLKKTTRQNFGGTDCSLPMHWAQNNKVPVDAFVVYTDNETWAGRRNHPSQALQAYRKAMGIDAKLVVVGVTATESTIADPKDLGMLDVVGFDTNAPNLISEFIRGW